jgi:hypothetical protein
VKIYYPLLTDGKRISTYMDETLSNIKKVVTDINVIVVSMFSKVNSQT